MSLHAEAALRLTLFAAFYYCAWTAGPFKPGRYLSTPPPRAWLALVALIGYLAPW